MTAAPACLPIAQLLPMASEFLRHHPGAGDRAAYDHVAAHGEPSVDFEQWVECGWARRARFASGDIYRHTEDQQMPDDRRIIPTEELIERGSDYYASHPGATHAEVYDHLETLGRPSVKKSSWIGVYGARAKKLGSVRGRQAAPHPPADPKPEPAFDDPTKEDSPTPEPDEEPGEPRVPALIETAGFSEGDRILVQLRGQKLDARRDEDRWSVDFEGSVGDDVVQALLGRVLGGS